MTGQIGVRYCRAMSETHETLLAGQYFAAIAGLAAMRRILRQPSEGQARMDDLVSVVSNLDEFPNNLRIPVIEHSVSDGYEKWAPFYDGPNPAIEAEEPIMHGWFDTIEPGRALDAGCGTGRHTVELLRRGHDVVGVDATRAMLAIAQSKAPSARFLLGQFSELPVGAGEFDLVTASLALTHIPDLRPAFAEFARVLVPGGDLLITDMHPLATLLGGSAGFRDPDNPNLALPFVPNLQHHLADYVNAAVGAGFRVDACVEAMTPESAIVSNPAFAVFPDAVRQAFDGLPFILAFRFVRGPQL